MTLLVYLSNDKILRILDITKFSDNLQESVYLDILPPSAYDSLLDISEKKLSNYSSIKNIVLNNDELINNLFKNKKLQTLFNHPILDLPYVEKFLSKTHINNLECIKMFMIEENWQRKVQFYFELMKKLLKQEEITNKKVSVK